MVAARGTDDENANNTGTPMEQASGLRYSDDEAGRWVISTVLASPILFIYELRPWRRQVMHDFGDKCASGHDFEEHIGFFKNRRVCSRCGYQDTDWGTGLVTTLAATALTAIVVLGATIFNDPDYPGPMDG
jgi:hypothetical protein